MKRKLNLILADVTSVGVDSMRKEIFAIIGELLQQKGITQEEYKSIEDEINNLQQDDKL